MVVNLSTSNFNKRMRMRKSFKSTYFKNAFFRLLIFFSLFWLLDFAIGNMLKKFYYKQRSGYDYLTTYSIDETRADVLIFGSSRAVNIFRPDIFEKELKLSCYNVGRLGQSIFYHYAVLKGVLKRYTPKIIILSFDAGNFSMRQESYDRLAALLPYYARHPEIRSIVQLKGPNERIKLLSNIYPYNSLLLPIITGNSTLGEKKFIHSNGFIPLNKYLAGPLRTVDYSKEKQLDSIKIKAYKSFILDCINANIDLYIVCPPYLINSIGVDYSLSEGQKNSSGV